MNPLAFLWRPEVPVFHVRLGGCGGCGEMVEELFDEGARTRPLIRKCSSPRHARLLLVTGFLTESLAGPFASVAAKAPRDCPVITAGFCSGGETAALPKDYLPISAVVEPQLVLDGCPVTVESVLEGIRDVVR